MGQMDQVPDSARQRRPGGRTADVTRRINKAVIELLAEGGVEACTFQSLASRAGVERSTLYRRDPELWPTIIGAIIEFGSTRRPAARTSR